MQKSVTETGVRSDLAFCSGQFTEKTKSGPIIELDKNAVRSGQSVLNVTSV